MIPAIITTGSRHLAPFIHIPLSFLPISPTSPLLPFLPHLRLLHFISLHLRLLHTFNPISIPLRFATFLSLFLFSQLHLAAPATDATPATPRYVFLSHLLGSSLPLTATPAMPRNIPTKPHAPKDCTFKGPGTCSKCVFSDDDRYEASWEKERTDRNAVRATGRETSSRMDSVRRRALGAGDSRTDRDAMRDSEAKDHRPATRMGASRDEDWTQATKTQSEFCRNVIHTGIFRFGDDCRYSHDIDEASKEDLRRASDAREARAAEKEKQPYIFFCEGYCRKGSACRFSHEAEGALREERQTIARRGSAAAIGSRTPTPSTPATTATGTASRRGFELSARPITATSTATASRQGSKRPATTPAAVTTNQRSGPSMAASRKSSDLRAAPRPPTPASSPVQASIGAHDLEWRSRFPDVNSDFEDWAATTYKSDKKSYELNMRAEHAHEEKSREYDEDLASYEDHGVIGADVTTMRDKDAKRGRAGMVRRMKKAQENFDNMEVDNLELDDLELDGRERTREVSKNGGGGGRKSKSAENVEEGEILE